MTKRTQTAARKALEKKLGPLRFGDLLMAERMSEQISLASLAKKLGISSDSLSMFEQEKALPTLTFAEMAARKLGYHAHYWKTVLKKQIQRTHAKKTKR